VLSNPEVNQRLARHFIGLRFDWEQGNHYKEQFGFILGTGDQLLLDPAGNVIKHGKTGPDGKPTIVYGRHGCDTTPLVLDNVISNYPAKPGPLDLKLEWFFWPNKPTRRPGGSYPVSDTAIAGFARLPLAIVHGPIPPALQNAEFLRWHVRQFIWVRGQADGESRLMIRRVKDGLKEGLPTELASLDPSTMTLGQLGQALDEAWLSYMKDRPLTARGYTENPHGAWMRGVKAQMIDEDDSVRRLARAGLLLPPGRRHGESAPYLEKSARIQ
jgi:hypothetical protein